MVSSGTSGGGRKKSSATMSLNFMSVGKEKIAPINEDRNAEEGEKEEEGAVEGTPFDSSLAKGGNAASGGA